MTRFILMLVLLSGCGTVPPPAEREAAPQGIATIGTGTPLRYLVLGDSTAVGVGGNYENGVAQRTAAHLAARERRVEMLNLAVSGARIADVATDQLQRIGDFTPDVVLLVVGANDVTHLTSARSAERDLRTILDSLVRRNCDVRVVLTGAADMTTPPRIPFLLRGLAGWRTRALNTVFRREAARYGFEFPELAEVTGPMFREDPSLFSDDRFHPNDRGYATWIRVINPALDRALSGASPHCEPSAAARHAN